MRRRFARSVAARLPAVLLLVLAVSAGADPGADYEARARKTGDKDCKGWLTLADFCEENLLWEKRTEALRKAVAASPDNAQAHARLDEKRRGKEWLPADEAEAKEIEESQAKGLVFYGSKWIQAKDAEKNREADRKSQGWDLDFRMDTAHLVLYSDRTVAETWRIAALLESEIETYRRFYGEVWKLEAKPAPIKVLLFGDRDTFEKVALSLGTPKEMIVSSGSGFYGQSVKTLLVGVGADALGDGAEERTAVHEMFHALDDQWAHCLHLSSPPWFLEGRAEHFRLSVSGRRVLPGRIHPGNSTALLLEKALDSVPLPTLLGTLQREYLQPPLDLERYAVSWGLVHFLFHGEDGRHAAGFRSFLKGVPARASKDDFEKNVGKASEIGKALDAYVGNVLLPALKRPE